MTDLIEVKTADLAGHALDWAVAQAEGLDAHLVPPQYNVPWRVFWTKRGQALEWNQIYNPHEKWEITGPLIDKHNVSLHCPQHEGDFWAAWITNSGKDVVQGADNALSAACRAVVAHRLGGTVRVPKELLT